MTTPTFLVGALSSTSLADGATTPLEAVQFGMRDGYVFELLDTSEPPSVVQTFVFPIPPRTYDLDEPLEISTNRS